MMQKPLKQAASYEEQIAAIRAKGVPVEDEARAIEILKATNYYRLTAYALAFRRQDRSFEPGVTFDRIYRIYEFDRVLRVILLAALEEMEIVFRSHISYYHSQKYGAEGYRNPNCFSPRYNKETFDRNFERQVNANTNALFVRHHMEVYDGHFPLWVAIELFSFGMLSRFYDDMLTADKKELIKEMYGEDCKYYDRISGWLRCCADLRNVCAHYSRLYFRKFSALPALENFYGGDGTRLWGAVLALRMLYLDKAKWNDGILLQLGILFARNEDAIVLKHIGFPPDWQEILKK